MSYANSFERHYTSERQVRVFISSTFRDPASGGTERDHLVTVVFPDPSTSLRAGPRERVEQLGLEFFDVDLRFRLRPAFAKGYGRAQQGYDGHGGVPSKDANGETANSWEYCRQWIDRVEPFFVCILGQRYGWVPEPLHFRESADRRRQEQQPRSITDLEVRHAVLDSRRKRRSYFYLRATPVSGEWETSANPCRSRLVDANRRVRDNRAV